MPAAAKNGASRARATGPYCATRSTIACSPGAGRRRTNVLHPATATIAPSPTTSGRIVEQRPALRIDGLSAGRGPRRAEAVTARELRQRFSPDGPVAADRPADRHHRVHAIVVGQADDRAHVLLDQEMIRRQAGPEAEGAAREDHVLNRRIDAGGGDVNQ